ncbi:hypothetical protein ACUL41_11255 [Virgibacillus natechei]|uniref:hypothetical protein n=1 Tax=Virgibacillus sp. CBA3643 TaxID=2942278 RepID=UPI0035A3B67E
MMELNAFMSELRGYAEQTHKLKDHYEKLSESEKKLVMDTAPDHLDSPEEIFHPVFRWLENLQAELDVKDKK